MTSVPVMTSVAIPVMLKCHHLGVNHIVQIQFHTPRGIGHRDEMFPPRVVLAMHELRGSPVDPSCSHPAGLQGGLPAFQYIGLGARSLNTS